MWETDCKRCGRRTRDATGTCRVCRTSVPDFRRMTTEQITGLVAGCRKELERRQSALTKALEEAA